MSRTLRITLLVSLFAAAGLLLAVSGCEKKEEPQPTETLKEQVESTVEDTAKAASGMELCTHCGQIKGSDACCKPDAEKCDKCGLAKGSPGCCKIPEGAEKVELCTHCGQIAGSDACCNPDAEKCDTCGLAKGSPLCCKLPQ